jgi:CHAT domain-containing protein/tetratricopeptide (TPR) repeat protein
MSMSPEEQGAVLLAAVNQLAGQGRYDDAIALVIQLADGIRSTSGEQSFEYASIVPKIADLNRMKGDLPAAEAAYRQAADLLRATAEPNHPLLGEVLNGLGLVLQSAGRLDEAEQYLTGGTNIFKNAFGESSAYYVFALNNLAELYALQGRYEQAIATYEQLLAIQRTLRGHPTESYGKRLTQLGGLFYELGRYQEAAQIFKESSDLARQAYGEKHLNYATSLSNLGMQYKMLGEWDQAEKVYRQAVDSARAAVGEDNPHYAIYISNLANLYRERGQYREAAPLLRRVVAIIEKYSDREDPNYSGALNNLAVLLLDMGQTAQAEELLREALEIERRTYGERHPKLIQSLVNLMTILLERGRYEEAGEFRKQADEAAEALGPAHPVQARITGLFSKAALRLGNFMDAEVYAVMAQEIWRRATGTDDPNYADALVDMGEVARARGRFQDAENVIRRALKVYRKSGTEGERVTTALRFLAGVYAATNRPNETLVTMQELADTDDRLLGQVFSVGTENQRASIIAELLSDLNLFVSLALRDPTAVPRAFDLVLRRKGVGAEALAVQRDAVLGGRYPHLKSQLQELRVWRGQIAQKTLSRPGPEGPQAHAKLLAEWNAQKERLEEGLVSQIPEMSLEQRLRAADRQTVSQALPLDSVLIEFVRSDVLDFDAVPERGEPYWLPAHYLAFVQPAGQPDHVEMVDLGEVEPLERLLNAYRSAITGEAEGAEPDQSGTADITQVTTHSDPMLLGQALVTTRQVGEAEELAEPADTEKILHLGEQLRQSLFDPLVRLLEGHARLFLAPDGELARLPFEALPLQAGRWLIDEYTISYLTAGRDALRFTQRSRGQASSPLVVAAPDYDLQQRPSAAFKPNSPFRPLDGAKQEGTVVAALLGVEPLIGAEALESAVKAYRSPLLLHISTHGFFLPNEKHDPERQGASLGLLDLSSSGPLERLSVLPNPLLRSGLALAGANSWLQAGELPEEAEDGILNGEDVTGMDLLDTELAVLSACQTGLGEVQTGEGVFGLRRAFVLAGAKTLVMSLWKAPDQATRELMEDFYQRILSGQPRAEALREARLALKIKYPEPFYWGAFILEGDSRPLPDKSS